MKKKNTLRLSTALFKGSFVHNPVLTQIIGICPIVGAATSVRNSLSLSLMLTVLLIFSEAFASLFLKRAPRWLRSCIYALFSMALILLSDSLFLTIAPGEGAGLGIYFYVLSINALIVIRCEKFACRTGALNAVTDGLAAGIGFGAVAIIVGAVRELLNYGTIFAPPDAAVRLSKTALTFVPLLILGFLAAIHKWLLIRFYPDQVRDTFSMHAAFEKPVKKDPGLFANKRAPEKNDFGSLHGRHEAPQEKGGKEL